MTKTKSAHRGEYFDDFLKTEGIFDEVNAKAIKEVIAWQLSQSMQEQNLTKVEMAKRMATSRAQLDRVLDPKNDGVTLETLMRAASVLGRKLRLELV